MHFLIFVVLHLPNIYLSFLMTGAICPQTYHKNTHRYSTAFRKKRLKF